MRFDFVLDEDLNVYMMEVSHYVYNVSLTLRVAQFVCVCVCMHMHE